MECYQAYQSGHADIDPSAKWYKGELGFFDVYIIPLGKKRKDCGVLALSRMNVSTMPCKAERNGRPRGGGFSLKCLRS
jgi:hypothetical protein